MADDPTTQESPKGETPTEEQSKPAETAAPSLADLPPAVANALEAERKRANSFERKFKDVQKQNEEYANQGKSETERLTAEREGLSKERDQLAAENRRLKVALDKKLPPELMGRLQGDSEEEMAEDADRLLALFTPPAPGRGAFDEGAREPVDEDALTTPEQAHQKFLNQLLNG